MMIKRTTIVQIHLIMASFLAAITCVFLFTGGLYTLDIKGGVDKQVFTVELDEGFPHDLDKLEDIARKFLLKKELALPSGDALLKKKKGKYELRWGDLKYAVKLKQGKKANQATLTFRERSFLTQMMRIHRAQAGDGFKVLSIFLVVGFLAIFATGFYLAYNIPRHRKPLFIGVGLGIGVLLGQVLFQI
jgi:hypothetical protein